jgi:hypothetical protein
MDIIILTTIKPSASVSLVIYFMKPTLVLLSKEAWFHLGGYTNSRNNRYWCAKISHFNPRRAVTYH